MPGSVILPAPFGFECRSCGGSIDAPRKLGFGIELTRRQGLSVMAPICERCASGANDLGAFVAAMRAKLVADYERHEAIQSGVLFLRKGQRKRGRRRFPAYGKELSERAVDPEAGITVVVDYQFAQSLCLHDGSALIVQERYDPRRYRFNVVAGQSVTVVHRPGASPPFLRDLAQALIDHDASEVILLQQPPAAGADRGQPLRILPMAE